MTHMSQVGISSWHLRKSTVKRVQFSHLWRWMKEKGAHERYWRIQRKFGKLKFPEVPSATRSDQILSVAERRKSGIAQIGSLDSTEDESSGNIKSAPSAKAAETIEMEEAASTSSTAPKGEEIAAQAIDTAEAL